MEIKLIEVRNRSTFIPALAMRVTSTGDVAGDWLRRRGGFSLDGASIILMRLTDCEAQYVTLPQASTPASGRSRPRARSPVLCSRGA
jgi:hypothetical protein